MSISAVQLLQGFNLHKIAEQAYLNDQEDKRKKKQQREKLTVTSVMTEKGFALVELFGYNFAKQIKQPMYEIGKKNNMIRANYEGYYKVMTQQWIDMGKFNLFLPILFKFLKGSNNTISFKDIDKYLQTCKSNLNPLIVKLKEKLPPKKIQQVIEALESLCEKEDLKGSGYVQKILVVDLMKKYVGEKENIEIDEELVKNDELDYVRLLSKQYLRAGSKIKELIHQFFLKKVLKAIKLVGKLKKQKKKKKQAVKRPSSVPAKKKQTKNEKLVREYIEQNKKQIKQDRKKIQNMAKSLVYQCIFAVFDLNIQKEVKTETQVFKSVYTTQPTIIQHQLTTNDSQSIKMYPGPNGTAIFVSDGQGKFINLMNGAINHTFNLKPSAIFKNSPIVDYLYFDDALIGIRQDGLLFSWGTQATSYSHVVQTQFRYTYKKLQHLNPRKILFISQGILVVNQTQINNNLSFYSTKLELVGRLSLKKEQFGIKACILSQVDALHELSQSLPRDSFIKSQQNLQSAIRSSYHQKEFILSSYLFKKYKELSVLKLEDYLNWITSYRTSNTLYLDKQLVARLRRKQPKKEDYQYLLKYHYIKQANLHGVETFLKTNSIKEVIKQQRQWFLYTLFEDNAMKQVQSPYITRQEFFQWIEKCSLKPEQIQKLLANLQFDCQAKICMSKFIKSQQYLRILSLQSDRFLSTQKYKINNLPPLLLNEVLPLPALDIFLVLPLFPLYNQIHVVSVNNITLNRIDLSIYSQINTNTTPIVVFCSETGYFFVCYANVITIWNIHKVSSKQCQPIKVIKQLEPITKPIIGMNVLYYSNSFATLTKQTIKFWDLDQLLFNPESADIVFQIKPGFKAIQKRNGVCRWQLKKKIYVNGKGDSLIAFPTKHSNYVIALLSRGQKPSNYYLKIFYLSKFKVKIRQDKVYQQIPLKITRLLQQQAQKNKYSDSIISPEKVNKTEEQLSQLIQKEYKQKLNQASTSANSTSCIAFINKFENYYTIFQQYSKIMQTKMRAILKDLIDPKYIKYNLIVKLHITQKQSQLEQLFQRQFLEFYKDENGKVDRTHIIDDLFEWQDKCFLNRLLCFSSMIYKYGRQYHCGYQQIVADPNHPGLVDLNSIEMMLGQSQMSKDIIVQTVNLLNNIRIGQPMEILKQIIERFLPTNYRYPSVRYYKTILTHSQQNPSEYFVNRFQNYTNQSLKQMFLSRRKYQNILQHIQKQALVQKIGQLTEKYPQIMKDNLQLIDLCMSYNFITEESAIFYYLNLPTHTLVNIIKKNQPKLKAKLNLDQIIQQISYAITNGKKKIPTPNFTYQWFYELTKSILESDDLIYSMFFQILNGSLLQHVAYSNQLLFLIDMNKKRVAIDYQPLHWKETIGSRIYPLTHHIPYLKQNIADKKLIKSLALEQILVQVVPKHATNLAMRFAFASLNPNSYQNDFTQQKALKIYNNMFINSEHLLKFLQQSKRDRETKVSSLPTYKLEKKKMIEVKIPAYYMLTHLSKTGALISYQSFSELLSYNMNEYSYGELITWMKTIPFRTLKNKDGSESKVCGIWEIKKLLKIDYTMLGWILLIKYNKLGILSKCLVIDGYIDTKQLNQIFFSESVFRLLSQSNKQLQIQQSGVKLQQLQLLLQKQIIGPSLQKLSQIFKSMFANQILNISFILEEIAKKNDDIELDKFVKYFLPSNEYKQIMVKLAIIGIIGKGKKIKVKQSFTRIVNYVNYKVVQEANPLIKWLNSTQSSINSLFELIYQVVCPHAISFNNEIKLQNVRIAQQHVNYLVREEVSWVFSFYPSLTLSQFFDYLIELKNQNGKLPYIINNCVLKIGLHSFLASFNNASFPQYYGKCKSVSKSMAKLTPYEFSQSFRRLSYPQKGISVSKLFKLTQFEISPEERINYIIEYKEKQEDQMPEMASLRISNLSQLTKYSINQLESVVNVLSYQQYLIKRYIKSANKLAFILKQIDNTQNLYNLLKQTQMSQTQANLLVKYFKAYVQDFLQRFREAQSKVSGDIDKKEQEILIINIVEYFEFFRKKMDLDNSQRFNCNFAIKEQTILQTLLFKRMQRQLSPEWSCLKSYINLYHYSQHLLVNVIFKKPVYHRLIKDEVSHSLSKLSLSYRNIYDLLGLAYQQNLQKYLPFLVAPAPNHHALEKNIFKLLSTYLFQSFVKYSQNIENKYPLNFNTFNKLFSQNDLRKQEEKVNHGQIFKKMNIWGCGYVNVNDIPQFRQKNTINPYIDINTYINLNFPVVKSWKKIKPPAQLTKNREKHVNQLLELQQPGCMKEKTIKIDNLWKILGYYLSEEHRLYIQHQFKSFKMKDCYDIVKVINWLSSDQVSYQQEKGPSILQKTVQAIEEKGGVYNIIRQYQKQILMAQQVDNYKQQLSFLLSFLNTTNRLEYQQLKETVNKLIKQNKIQIYLQTFVSTSNIEKAQNKNWLLEVLILIIDTYNRQVREWMNYNNQLVKFLNQLTEKQYMLLKKLYHNNWIQSYHKLFDIMANGSNYFTFSTFWVYNTNNDEAYPYTKEEVKEVYQIIDVNSDGNISYQQFSRFWNAVDQIFDNPPSPTSTSISNLKSEIVELFLLLLQPLIDKGVQFEQDQLDLPSMESLTNIKNRQKIQRLVKLISTEDQLRLKLDLHKLKIMLKQLKVKRLKEKFENIKHQNYFAKCFGSNILSFIENKDSLQFCLGKWLYFTYPSYGALLTQYCYEEFNWNKQKISQWISQYIAPPPPSQEKIQKSGAKLINPNIQPKNVQFYNCVKPIPDMFYKFYKKNSRKSAQVKKYGQSISQHLYLTKILQDYKILLSQIDQIQYFLQTSLEHEHLALIYSIEQDKNWRYGDELDKKDKKFQQMLNKADFENQNQTLEICPNISCKVWRKDFYIKRQYTLMNNELRGKSNNRFSFLTQKSLYEDRLISISIVDMQKSNGSQLFISSDYTTYKPLIGLRLIEGGKFTSIMTMIRLVELALYLQINYQLAGLFADPSQLCLDFYGQKDFRFSNFYAAIKLDEQGNYLQGVNPLQLTSQNNSLIIPPQTYQDIFTQTYDSYCIAHILYYLFTGEFISNSSNSASLQQSLWCNYSVLHHKCIKHIAFLAEQDKNIDIEAEIVFYTLLYECTHYQWHLRPKVFQILQTMQTISQMAANNLENIGKSLIIKPTVPQYCLRAINQKDYDLLNQYYTKNEYAWSVKELQEIRVVIPNESKYFTLFSQMLIDKLHQLSQNYTLEQISQFMEVSVDYVCSSDKKNTAYFALQTYKDIISSEIVKRYFDYCDELWKINQFNIQEKLKQLNMQDRIEKLPKSSQYYFDISTLVDSKITLYLCQNQLKVKKHDSTKKIALTFIESSLTSNNVNKISAVYKSEVIKNLYKYIEDKQFGPTVLKIYGLITVCLNQDDKIDIHRTIEQGYKVMMVMHNIINLQKGVKKGETVVEMLTFMNNYYNFYGEQCKTVVLKQICDKHVCNLPTLTYLFNTKTASVDYLYQVLLNLTYEERYYKKLKLVTVRAYELHLRDIKKQAKFAQIGTSLQRLIKKHQFGYSLLEIGVQTNLIQSRIQCASKSELPTCYSQVQNLIDKHITFYTKKKEQKDEKILEYRFQNNYNEHFTNFLAFTRKLSLRQLQNQQVNLAICNLLQKIIEFHNQLFDFWHDQQPTIRFILTMAQKIYEKEYLYNENMLLNSLEKPIFSIILKLINTERRKLMRLGFIHLFFRIMKRQHELTELYISKKVQNLQLKNTYVQQAEFRLNVIHQLLQTKELEIHRMFIIVGFGKYLVQYMFNSKLFLDLRFYKSTFDLVPFRFCNPLRSEAITIFSSVLPIKESPLKSEVVSRLIPLIIEEKAKLQQYADTPQAKMRFVETLWLFGNLIECQDERLRYEMVNNGSYEVINKLIQKHGLLSQFFPKMSETIKTGSILRSSVVFSKLLQK